MSVKQPRILVIEDEKPLRDLYVELLKEKGYDVESSADGLSGLSKLKSGGWDVILLDIILPKMDGISILELINKDPPSVSNGPIILLTALAQDSLIHKGLSLGAAGYLVKSEITPDSVLQEVHNFLQKK